MKINFFERQQIDDLKWNQAIDESVNGIVYAYTWYLDIVSPYWCALADDGYNYLFPLPVKQKFGVNILLQPLFTQQLGLFYRKQVNQEILNEFLLRVADRFKLVSINLNTFNRADFSCLRITGRVTYQLDLISTYSKLQEKYSQNTKRNNLKAFAMDVRVVQNIDVGDFIDFYRKNNSVKFRENIYTQVRSIIDSCIVNKKGQLIGAYVNEILVASAFIVYGNGKIIYLLAASSGMGLTKRAMFALVDQLIRWNSETHNVLDFEGSIIPSVARFYAGFGANSYEYQHIEMNKLSTYHKLLFSSTSFLKKTFRKLI